MTKNIAVLGLDDFNLALFRTVRNFDSYSFHRILSKEELVGASRYSMSDLLAKADRQLRSIDGRVDAVVGYWDFPTTLILPVLRRKAGLATTSLESVLRCVHKYWSRCVQRRTASELVPRCIPFDPFAENPLSAIDLAPPFWIKPIKAHSSILGFRIDSEQDFQAALPRIRKKIERFAEPFNHIFRLAELPAEIAAIDGHHCIAEEFIAAEYQCTLEGYVLRGRPRVYGIVDSLREQHGSAFSRYQYPTCMPVPVQQRMIDAAERVMRATGLDNEPFNMEFFYDPDRDRLALLEINPRVSKSHFPLFAMVEGASHQEVMLEVALGIEPVFPQRKGRYPVAAKFMVRRFADGVVRRVPSPAEIRDLEGSLSGVRIQVEVAAGDRLSELVNQDSYSYETAAIFVGGRNEQDLEEKYHFCLDRLRLEIDEA
jgi:hypothetical protein